ncbi:aminomethyltransferase family protein [Desulfogranum japonicum]|uniref:aminomethyltransferase family protein n=1 Tax=Desulfogranum japonicum TaxID=231447 RepID=UPI00040F5A02|nr:aminomethyltransferase family protein [Desulfogranum japonicum]
MKQTPLHSWHMRQSANMAEFGSYEMPLWYPSGAKSEHLAVITSAGLFDTSHMSVLTIHGKDSRLLLQRCFTKDLDNCIGPKKNELVAGRCVYGLFLDEQAHVIDDAIVYQFATDSYMLVVNAAMGAPIAEHLRQHSKKTEEVTVTDLTDKVGKMDIQGPASTRILSRLLANWQAVFDKMIYFSFKGTFDPHLLSAEQVHLQDGTPLMVSRTGYTGEFGFELFVAPEHIQSVWNQILTAGKDEGLIACGLAARDSLRAGAVLPLSHQDIGAWPFMHNPWLFTLPTDTDGGFSKQFLGAEALLHPGESMWTYPFAGFDLRKIVITEKSYVVDDQGNNIGTILTCATDMAIDRIQGTIVSLATPEDDGKPEDFAPRGLCCGFIRVNRQMEPGAQVTLTDGKRKIPVEIRTDVRPHRTARKPMAAMLP